MLAVFLALYLIAALTGVYSATVGFRTARHVDMERAPDVPGSQ